MRLRRYSVFTTEDESWWGDCPRWIASMRRRRPDMRETHGQLLTARPIVCTTCANGYSHG